ncbi:hypothetical protein [Legionella cherrii]|uniref:Uncharacterized protein n=1 Tax=Legionella cherrii TaxID=28084 RepID=A0A0W0SHA3_9GAMM|nr:hypothetical protein [Legionella cherrii]KTC82277.1 hypothetical protein Lche_0541 [Legionella cherrii]VEB32762.1 Uncharacterised protein [Legionella cherrii]
MQKKYESTTMGATKKEKKTVSWNDNKTEGKIDEEHLQIGEAASPTKQILEDHIKELQQTGYTELEATAIVGKAQTPSGTVIITEPIFYDSKEKIAERKFLAAQTNSHIGKEESPDSEVNVSSSRDKERWVEAVTTPKEKSPSSGSEAQGAKLALPTQENKQEKENAVNPHSFFSPTTIGVGVILGVAATLGFAALRK